MENITETCRSITEAIIALLPSLNGSNDRFVCVTVNSVSGKVMVARNRGAP